MREEAHERSSYLHNHVIMLSCTVMYFHVFMNSSCHCVILIHTPSSLLLPQYSSISHTLRATNLKHIRSRIICHADQRDETIKRKRTKKPTLRNTGMQIAEVASVHTFAASFFFPAHTLRSLALSEHFPPSRYEQLSVEDMKRAWNPEAHQNAARACLK